MLDPSYNIPFFTTGFAVKEVFDSRWVREAEEVFQETIDDYTPLSAQDDPLPPPSPVKSRVRRPAPASDDFTFANVKILGPLSSSVAPKVDPLDGHQQWANFKLEKQIGGNENPFEWWRRNESEYPILVHMAQFYLAIPGESLTWYSFVCY